MRKRPCFSKDISALLDGECPPPETNGSSNNSREYELIKRERQSQLEELRCLRQLVRDWCVEEVREFSKEHSLWERLAQEIEKDRCRGVECACQDETERELQSIDAVNSMASHHYRYFVSAAVCACLLIIAVLPLSRGSNIKVAPNSEASMASSAPMVDHTDLVLLKRPEVPTSGQHELMNVVLVSERSSRALSSRSRASRYVSRRVASRLLTEDIFDNVQSTKEFRASGADIHWVRGRNSVHLYASRNNEAAPVLWVAGK